jgi:hypothetical protein
MASAGVRAVTWTAAIGWSLLKSVIVMLAGTVTAVQLVAWLHSVSPRWRVSLWTLVLIPSLTPSLVTGYCYRDTAMAMVHLGWRKEALFTAIIAGQVVPIAALLMWFAPRPAVSASAVHCQRLFRSTNVSSWRLWLQANFRSLLPAAAILFLLSFQEADLASLMQTANWTEWLFMRHTSGLPVAELLKRAVLPVAIQLPAFIPIFLWLTAPSSSFGESPAPFRATRIGRCWGIIWMLVSLTIVVFIPVWQLCRGARQGAGALWLQPQTWREISDALLIAVTCGGLAMVTSMMLLRTVSRQGGHWWTQGDPKGTPRHQWHTGLFTVLLLPGLLGNLTLGLLIAAVFQTPLLASAYNTPVPLIVGQTLALLPRTALLWCCLSRMSTGTEAHVLTLLKRSATRTSRQAAETRWLVVGRIWFAAAVLVCFWAYLDVLLQSLLEMPGMEPVGKLLYNALHYGRISALAAKLVLAMAVPFLAAAAILLLRRVVSRARWS